MLLRRHSNDSQLNEDLPSFLAYNLIKTKQPQNNHKTTTKQLQFIQYAKVIIPSRYFLNLFGNIVINKSIT